MRQWAIQQMNEEGPDAFARLASAIDDESPLVRGQAVEALGRHGDAALGPVERLLTREPDADVRAAALRALADVGGDSATELVVSRIRDADVRVRAAAAEALGRVGGRRAQEALGQLVRDVEPAVRLGALTALAFHVGDASAVTALRLGLEDGDDTIRAVAGALLQDIERVTGRPSCGTTPVDPCSARID